MKRNISYPGAQLLSHVAAFALAENATCIYLHMLASDEKLLTFYRRNGMPQSAFALHYVFNSLPATIHFLCDATEIVIVSARNGQTAGLVCYRHPLIGPSLLGYEVHLFLPEFYQMATSRADARLLGRMLSGQQGSGFAR